MTTLEICNAALSRLAEVRIVALTDDKPAARTLVVNLPIARHEVLRAHRWNFASKRATLSQDEDTPAFGYDYQYTLPTDCLRVLEVNEVSGSGDPLDDWEIEGRKILIDDAEVNIIYVADVEDYAQWDALAQSALICLLASKIAPAIHGGSTSKAKDLLEEYSQLIAPIARRIDANESRRRNENFMDQMLRGSRALQARGSGS